MNGTIELRPIVKWFAEQMELQLRANDWKGGWDDCPLAYLNGRLREETVEDRSRKAKGVRKRNGENNRMSRLPG